MTRIFAESLENIEVSTVATSTSSNPTRITNIQNATAGTTNTAFYAGMGVSYKTGASSSTIADNSYTTSITHSGSGYAVMNQNAALTDADHTVIFNKSNYNVPTNPKFRTFGAYSSSERLYTIVYDKNPLSFTDATCDLTNSDATVTCDASATIKVGMIVTYGSSGIADGTYVKSINTGTEGSNVSSFELSANFTGTGANNQTLTFTSGGLFKQQLATGDSADTEYSNLETTEGFKIISFDFNSRAGVKLDMNLTTHNYFVLVHSDDYLKHHFAKITSKITENNFHTEGVSIENTVIGFEFEPKLGDELLRDSKFMVFKGPSISDTDRDCNILAVSAGIKKDLQDNLVCSQPLFYFFNDKLDKDNQLDHNTKCFTKFLGGNTTTIAPIITNTFVTCQDNRKVIKDYSKFTHNLTMVDNLKKLDAPDFDNTAFSQYNILNEYDGGTVTTWNRALNFTNYDKCFTNARRDTDNDIFNPDSQSFRGPIRYIHYDFSPNRTNKTYNVIDLTMEDSVGNRGSFIETKIVDSKRIMPTKIFTNDKIRIRHRLHKGKFNDWFALKAKIKSSLGSNEYRFTTEYDLSTMFNVGDEVKIGTDASSPILIIETIDAINNFGTTGKEQDITFRAESRIENGSIFASTGYTLSEGAVIYRRAWNTTDKTLLTTFDILENRNNNLYVKLISNHFGFLEATVTASDKNKQMLTLDFTTTNRSISSLDYMYGSYYIEVEKFTGSIEKTSYYKQDGQTILQLAGRSDSRKLLGPIINKNLLHSEDIVYSSSSPYNRLGYVDAYSQTDRVVVCSFDSKHVVFSGTHRLSVGDNIYLLHDSHNTISYIGEVDGLGGVDGDGDFDGSNPTTEVYLVDYSLAESSTNPSDEDIGLFARTKHYIFNKALSSNRVLNTSTDLTGTATKGLYFTGGKKISSNGAESTNLIGTGVGTDSRGLGYHISDCISMSNDSKFQIRLDDDASGTTTETDKTYETFDTINTLIDFNILTNTYDEDTNTSIIEIAPHLPLTLGRVDINYANTTDTTFNATTLGVGTGTIGNRYFTLPDTATNALSSIASPRKYHNEPIYADGVFIGILLKVDNNFPFTSVTVYLDRPLSITLSGQTIQTITPTGNFGETSKLTHELNLLNGAHLHGGKMIGLLSPYTRTGSVPAGSGVSLFMNYPLYYNSMTTANSVEAKTYSEKYGAPMYRIYNLEKGNYNTIVNEAGSTYNNIGDGDGNNYYYAETLSKIPYYASAYRFNFGHSLDVTSSYTNPTFKNHVTGVGKTDKGVNKHLLPESRGLTNVAGSRYFDTRIHAKNASERTVAFNYGHNWFQLFEHSQANGTSPYVAKDHMNHIDPKVTRMFLFANCDLHPYSSKRADSLMQGSQTRTISDYGLFALNKPASSSNSDTKSMSIGSSSSVNLLDSSYSFSNIISSDKTINTLKRFSMMRLTEVVIDWAFNQFDPENIVSKKRTIPPFLYASYDWFSLQSFWSGNEVQTADYNNTNKTITADSDISGSLAANDILVDSAGRFIGVVASVSTTTITLDDYPKKTDGTNYYSGILYKIEALTKDGTNHTYNAANIEGHGGRDTFTQFTDSIHMLQSIVIHDTPDYGSSGSAWHDAFSSDLDESTGDPARSANTYLPISIEQYATDLAGGVEISDLANSAHTAKAYHPSQVLKIFDSLDGIGNVTTPSGVDTLMGGFLPLFLDRFSVENDGGSRVTKGTVGGPVKCWSVKDSRHDTADPDTSDISIIGLGLYTDFALYDNASGSSRTYDKDADGVMMGFKPRLYIDTISGVSTNKAAGNQTIYTYIIDPDGSDITNVETRDYSESDDTGTFTGVNKKSLHHMNDLTGTYLVSEIGKYYNSSDVKTTSNETFANPISLNNYYPKDICYVISHEIDTTNTSKRHIIRTDKALAVGWYRIMQPNHTCFYDFSPQEIRINELSSSYTKVSGENKCYTDITDYLISNKAGPRGQVGNYNNTGGQEAALSMYVVIDVDGQSGENYVVLREPDSMANLLGISQEYDICISDGDNVHKSSLVYKDRGDTEIGHSLQFSDMQEKLGVVSISETINLTITDEVDSDAKRCMIGATAIIGEEAENVINDLLLEHDIPNTMDSSEYSYMLAPNFQGINLFDAIYYLLNRKDKIAYFEDETYKVIKAADDSFLTGVFIQDAGSSDIELYEYEKEENLFDLKNDITVYGGSKKANRKDFKSIKIHGTKSLEVHEYNLIGQEEIDKRATELLELHTKLNQKITITVGHKGVSQLKAGDIIELEIRRENIPRNQYMILQIEHLLTGNMKLQLGRYSKQLQDRFSEISIDINQIKTNTRKKSYSDAFVGLVNTDTFKIKPIRLVIRERKSSGGAVIGFGTPLNTSTRPLGHEDGSGVTHTTLLEEDY